jgi:hypothetical protein
VRQIANRATMLDAVKKLHANAANAHATRGGIDVHVATAEPDGPPHVVASSSCVRAPRQIVASEGTEEDVIAQVRAAGLELPLLAKSLVANGTADSHKVAIVHDVEGLRCVVRGDVAGLRPPCVIQEYVNHGGCLFKVYVVGDAVRFPYFFFETASHAVLYTYTYSTLLFERTRTVRVRVRVPFYTCARRFSRTFRFVSFRFVSFHPPVSRSTDLTDEI